MRRTLLISNDFPPRTGGIQSYVHAIAERLPADDLVVYAPSWPGDADFDARQAFEVVRHSGSLMLPFGAVGRRAEALIREHRCTAVWFGAAAPLGLLAGRLRAAGVQRAVASTHGHEIGWSMVPGARRALRAIGERNDVVTFVSRYVRSRVAAALGPMAALEYLPPGVDSARFTPDPAARRRVRDRHGLGTAPLVVCVSRMVARKGQDTLVSAMPRLLRAVPDAALLLVGDGPLRESLERRARAAGVAHRVVFAGSVPAGELPAHYAAGDVFAMPCRTRGGGLDVEGLGLVFLEASAAGVPVVAGHSGGAPETVLPGVSGSVVDGRDTALVADTLAGMLDRPEHARALGRAGRRWVEQSWTWEASAARLAELLSA